MAESEPHLEQVRAATDRLFADKHPQGQSTRTLRQRLREVVTDPDLSVHLATGEALNHLVASVSEHKCERSFASATEKELPQLLVHLVAQVSDNSHLSLLQLLPAGSGKIMLSGLKRLNGYLEDVPEAQFHLRAMRVARIMADLYRHLGAESGFWRRRTPPPCCIDDKALRTLKEQKRTDELASAYEARVGQLQHADLRHALARALDGSTVGCMVREDYQKLFQVEAPLRIGISSANASDNHLRTREQGAKTLNAGIDLQIEGEREPLPPLRVTARRLNDPVLILRSRSLGFRADFEVGPRGDAAAGSSQFFAYRNGGDEALRLVKQALVQTGIIRDDSNDVLADVAEFTGGGGLEIITRSKVLQGSGLGTSSILAASILKLLYRLTGSSEATDEGEYPSLYDQSLLLEQSVGLNSGWQDARGAFGGSGAIKSFVASPTTGLPSPSCEFLDRVDPSVFADRVVLFDTGIARAATRGLNVLLDAYLCRDRDKYSAMRQSFLVHDQMVAALRAGDYPRLGVGATDYWKLRCQLDPEATNEAIQSLFQSPEIARLSHGGMLTGAGGGGFALLISRDGASHLLKRTLGHLHTQPAFADSRVVEYRLNRTGIKLSE